MILNASKCHFLVRGPQNHVQYIFMEVGGEVIWESSKEKLLGVTIDKKLNINSNLSDILQKAGYYGYNFRSSCQHNAFCKKEGTDECCHFGFILIWPFVRYVFAQKQ